MELEVISRLPEGGRRGPPLLFVHGAYVGAWCWDEYFLGYFAQRGYASHALSLRGHGRSQGRDSLDAHGIDDYVADLLNTVRTLDEPPVLIGHSMGAIVVQRAMLRAKAPAAVLMAPVPPHGLADTTFKLALRDPKTFMALAALQSGSSRSVPLALREWMFSPQVPEEDALRHAQRVQHESQRALFDLSWPQFLWINAGRRPVLVLGAALDTFFPPPYVQEAATVHGTVAEIIPDMGHCMMLEPAWRTVADRILDWLGSQSA